MATLYSLGDQILALDQLLVDLDGDLSDPQVQAVFEEWWAEYDGLLNDKVDGYVHFIKELEARAEARKVEAKRLSDAAKASANKAKRLRGMLLEQMRRMDIQVLNTGVHEVKIRKNGGQQPLDIHADIPDEYMYEKVEVVPNKAQIRKDLDEGKELDFAILQERGERLAIT